MSEVRTARPGLFVGGDDGGSPGGGVTSFNGRTGAVVSAVGDYIAALVFNATPEVADFDFVPGTVHVIDSASTDPKLTGRLPANPPDKCVVGWWFNQPTGPFGDDAGLDVDPNGKTITGNPFPFFFHTRFPGGAYYLQFSAAADTWVIPSWCDFILGNAPYADPSVMVRRSSAFGQLLFPLTLLPNSLLWRPGSGDVQGGSIAAPAVLANFDAKAYTATSGLAAYSNVQFAKALNTLLPWVASQNVDFTAAVNEAVPVAPASGQRIRVTLPAPADLVGGEQFMVSHVGANDGGVVLDATTAGFVINGVGVQPAPAATLYTLTARGAIVFGQYDLASNAWHLIVSGYDRARVQRGSVHVLLAGGATEDLPGPDAGFVRFYQNITFTRAVQAVQPDPVDVTLVNTVTTDEWRLPQYSGAEFNPTPGMWTPIGADEVIRLESTGPTSAVAVAATFVDEPAEGITLVRLTLADATPTEAIPAAPDGFFRRWCRVQLRRDDWVDSQAMEGNGVAAMLVGNASANADVDFLLGADLVSRLLGLESIYAAMPPGPAGDLSVTDTELNVAVSTVLAPGDDVLVLGAWEQIPLSNESPLS